MRCPLCQKDDFSFLYGVKDIPIFQNKVYKTVEAAKNAQTADVSLVRCHHCGFVFNADFDAKLMSYDSQYQNEQAYSEYFQHYLEDIAGFLQRKTFHNARIVEIGCGKGYFLEKLRKYGFDVTGFDPGYEGNNPYIIKDYFTEKYSQLNADVILLRHTLEHIANPLEFLHTIAKASAYQGMIFIEVPNLAWILYKGAFWDIFYEHCNYFTPESLGSLFQKSEQGRLFNDQYMYLLANLRDLRKHATPTKVTTNYQFSNLTRHVKEYQQFVQSHQPLLLWGAGAKGATFVTVMDPDRKFITYIVDINPKKQQHYIAKTAHKIISPTLLHTLRGGNMLIMNENYYPEIKKEMEPLNFNLYVLGVN